MSATHGYPAEWESDVVLTDGGTAHVRPIRPTDADALVALHARLSEETIYLRFFTPHPVLSTLEIERFTQVDYDDRMALIAELDDEMVAVARYDRFSQLRREILALSRENTNVQSTTISLSRRRRLMLLSQDALAALRQAIEQGPGAGATHGSPANPR